MVAAASDALPVALADMPLAEWAAAVVVRHSARTFTGAAAETAVLERLERFTAGLPGRDTARVVIVRDVA